MLPQGVRFGRDFAIRPPSMFLRRKPAIEPCLPRPATEPPSGPGWIHEIKHVGFLVLARRDEKSVRLFIRNGFDFTAPFAKITAAVERLGARSCVLDGEAIVVDERGLSVFEVLRYRLCDDAAILCVFDLIELDGDEPRWQPLEDRKTTLADLLRRGHDGVTFNQHFHRRRRDHLPPCVRARLRRHLLEAARLALSLWWVEHWLKIKNPAAPAVNREAEEDWGDGREDEDRKAVITERRSPPAVAPGKHLETRRVAAAPKQRVTPRWGRGVADSNPATPTDT
jgi:bifunctional non-homologous end joining protein LigD